MRIYRNLDEIQKKEKLGRQITLVGLIVLFVGLLSSFTPNWYPPDAEVGNALLRFLQMYWAYISFGALALGFIASNIGSYYINRFAPRRWPNSDRVARPDEILAQSMKGFDNKYTLFLWSLSVTSYLLVGPSGIFIFILRGDKGQVTVQGDKWKEAFSITRFFTAFTREGLGNPSRELTETEQKVEQLLQAGVESGELDADISDVPIEGAVVFINPAVELNLEGPNVSVLHSDEMKKFLRSKGKETRIDNADLRAITEYLHEKSVITEEEE